MNTLGENSNTAGLMNLKGMWWTWEIISILRKINNIWFFFFLYLQKQYLCLYLYVQTMFTIHPNNVCFDMNRIWNYKNSVYIHSNNVYVYTNNVEI